MTTQTIIPQDMQDAMLRRNYENLTTTLALLVPWGPYKISDRIDLQSYHSRFNLTSSRVLTQRVRVVAANLSDWEYEYGSPHELDIDFHTLEDVTVAARNHLLDVPFSAMDAELASGGNTAQWNFGKLIAAGGSNLFCSGLALKPFFFNEDQPFGVT